MRSRLRPEKPPRGFRKGKKFGGKLFNGGKGAPLGSVSYKVRDRNPRVRVGSIWAAPPESYSVPAPVAEFRRSRRLDPSPAALPPATDRVPAAVAAPPEHRALLPPTSRKLLPFEHSRQPDEFWCSIPRATCRWLAVRFF